MGAAHLDVLTQRLTDLRALAGHRALAGVEVRFADVERLGQRADLERFLAGRLARSGELRDLLAHCVAADALRQPAVAALDDSAQRRAFPPANPDRWPWRLDRSRRETHVVDVEPLAVPRHVLLAQRQVDHIERLVEDATALRERNAIRLELRFH